MRAPVTRSAAVPGRGTAGGSNVPHRAARVLPPSRFRGVWGVSHRFWGALRQKMGISPFSAKSGFCALHMLPLSAACEAGNGSQKFEQFLLQVFGGFVLRQQTPQWVPCSVFQPFCKTPAQSVAENFLGFFTLNVILSYKR